MKGRIKKKKREQIISNLDKTSNAACLREDA
jgi:hypothetical protein